MSTIAMVYRNNLLVVFFIHLSYHLEEFMKFHNIFLLSVKIGDEVYCSMAADMEIVVYATEDIIATRDSYCIKHEYNKFGIFDVPAFSVPYMICDGLYRIIPI
jgi:hypothetical protein